LSQFVSNGIPSLIKYCIQLICDSVGRSSLKIAVGVPTKYPGSARSDKVLLNLENFGVAYSYKFYVY